MRSYTPTTYKSNNMGYARPKGNTVKKKEHAGAYTGRDARKQAEEAAKIADKKREGKVLFRIDHRTEILIWPDEVEYFTRKYGLEELAKK